MSSRDVKKKCNTFKSVLADRRSSKDVDSFHQQSSQQSIAAGQKKNPLNSGDKEKRDYCIYKAWADEEEGRLHSFEFILTSIHKLRFPNVKLWAYTTCAFLIGIVYLRLLNRNLPTQGPSKTVLRHSWQLVITITEKPSNEELLSCQISLISPWSTKPSAGSAYYRKLNYFFPEGLYLFKAPRSQPYSFQPSSLQ